MLLTAFPTIINAIVPFYPIGNGADDSDALARLISLLPPYGVATVVLDRQARYVINTAAIAIARSNTWIIGNGAELYTSVQLYQPGGGIAHSQVVAGVTPVSKFTCTSNILSFVNDAIQARYVPIQAASTGILPTGLAQNATYYITGMAADGTFVLSNSPTGGPVTVSSSGSGNMAVGQNLILPSGINTSTGTITTTAAHNLQVGDEVFIATTNNPLPSGLAISTSYFVVSIASPTTLQLSATYGGSVIVPSTQGGGVLGITKKYSGIRILGTKHTDTSGGSNRAISLNSRSATNCEIRGITANMTDAAIGYGLYGHIIAESVITNNNGGVLSASSGVSSNNLISNIRFLAGTLNGPADVVLTTPSTNNTVTGCAFTSKDVSNFGTSNNIFNNYHVPLVISAGPANLIANVFHTCTASATLLTLPASDTVVVGDKVTVKNAGSGVTAVQGGTTQGGGGTQDNIFTTTQVASVNLIIGDCRVFAWDGTNWEMQ